MDELFEQITARTGVDASVARQAAGIIFGFLAHEGPSGPVSDLLDRLPGARELADASGGGTGGLIGVFGDLTGAGLGMGEIQDAAGAVLDYARAKAGPDTVNAVIEGIPGLDQFI